MCPGCFVTWINQLIPSDIMMVGGSGVLCYLDSLTVSLDIISDRNMKYPVLICLLDVK